MSRILVLALLVVSAFVAGGCGGGSQSSQGSAASSGEVDGGAELTHEVVAELSAQAAISACATCSAGTIYIRDHLLEAGTLVGDESPMPDVVRERLSDVFDEVEFVSGDEEREVLGDDLLPESGIVIYIGSLRRLDTDVLGIDIGLITEGDGFTAKTVQFAWDGEAWRLATSEDTGVTVTTSVS